MSLRRNVKMLFQVIVLGTAVFLSLATTVTHYRPLTTVYEYDPVTDEWRLKAAVPRPRIDPVCQVCEDKIYLISGRVGREGDRPRLYVDVYDPAQDEWSACADAILPVLKGWSSACSAGSHIYVIGSYGKRKGSYLPSLLEYDTVANVWTRKTDILFGGVNGRCFVIGDDIYVDLYDYQDYYQPDHFMQRYTISTDSWSTCADPPGVTFASDDKIYTVGKYNSPEEVYEYDPALNIWLPRTSKPTPERPGVVVADGSKIYLFCERVEAYDTATDMWETKSSVPNSLYWSAKGFSIGGKIYIIFHSGELAEYDPATDSWEWRANFAEFAGASGIDEHDTHDILARANWVTAGGKIYAIGGYFGPYE